MTSPLRIQIEDWLGGPHGAEHERQTLADIKILAGDRVLTHVDDRRAKTTRDSVHLCAYHLAYWLAENWWRLRWEPEPGEADAHWGMSHCLAAADQGCIWPPLTFASDGKAIRLTFRASHQSAEISPIRYVERLDDMVTATQFESAVDAFLDSTIARLNALGLRQSALEMLWAEVTRERHDPNLSRQRRLEALLGIDAGEADDGLAIPIADYSARFGQDALDEIAAAAKGDVLQELERTDDSRSQASEPVHLADRQVLTARFGELDPQCQFPWQLGERLADAARAQWGLGCDPIASRRLADIAGASVALLAEGAESPLGPAMDGVAFREPDDENRIRMLIRSPRATNRRFQFARLLAEDIVCGKDAVLPATRAKTARQKLQRAFAAQLLCPFDALRAMLPGSPDDDDIEEAARQFDVSPLLVRTSLVNKGTLAREQLGA